MSDGIFDSKDALLLAAKIEARNKLEGPRIGDFVWMLDGSLARFTHDWGDSIQTTPQGTGSFCLGTSGYTSYSGGLDPAIPKAELQLWHEEMNGRFWFFHHDAQRAHNGVNIDIGCRVYRHTKGALRE